MWKAWTALMIFTLAACSQAPQATPRAPVVLGQVGDDQDVLRFRITRSSALGVVPVSNDAINARALQLCPEGYTEIARRGEATRRISGVFYTDVDVTIVCS